MSTEPVFAPSDFVGVFNQTLDMAYPSVIIEGEVSELRVRKQRWVYFSLQDEFARVQFFGSTHALQHPIEDGMMVQVKGVPRLHPLYGFSVNVQFMKPVGEGSIKKSADAVMQKLKKEGLFDESKKRQLSLPLSKMALITSAESAAYHDFIKIYTERWSGTVIDVYDVHVQGEQATADIVAALRHCNAPGAPEYEAIVLTRGGGSPEDLAVFSSEPVTRAVATSVVLTVVAVGHEIDVSLAELAADARASTPTNAASMVSLDKRDESRWLMQMRRDGASVLARMVDVTYSELDEYRVTLGRTMLHVLAQQKQTLLHMSVLLQAFDPRAPLSRGYALVRTQDGTVVRSGSKVQSGDAVTLELQDALVSALVESVENKQGK